MPVDNDTRLWTTCGPNVENTLPAARTRVDARVQPSAALNESAFCATVVSEGHPRGNGDGPLTRITRLNRGRGCIQHAS